MTSIPRGFYPVKLKSGSKVHSTISNVNQATLDAKGSYSKVIFFIHGFPDNNTSFNGVLPIVKSEFKGEKVLMLAPLLRGYEKSSFHDSDSDYSTKQVAQDIFNFIEELQVENASIHLVGHDWGAITAFKAASIRPELFSSIITLAIPYLSNVHAWDFLWRFPEQIYLSSYFLTMQRKQWYSKFYQTSGDDSYLNQLWNYWAPNYKYTSKEIESVRSTLLADNAIDHCTAYYRCLFNPKLLRETKWYVDFDKVPTLLLGGRTDGCMSDKIYEFERYKLAKYDKVDVRILSNVGHFLHREDPAKVADLIIDFIHKYSESLSKL